MTQKNFLTVAGVVFGLVTALHGARLLFRWEAVIGGWLVPQWVSVAGVVIAGWLALTAFKLRAKS